MTINEFCKHEGITKKQLSENLGYAHKQSLTYVDRRRSVTFMLKMLRKYPKVFVTYEEELNRHDLSLFPIQEYFLIK